MRFARLLLTFSFILSLSLVAFPQSAPCLWGEFRIPRTDGKDSISKNYKGNFDIGIGYNFLNYSKLTIGIGINFADFSLTTKDLTYSYLSGHMFIYTPSILLSYAYPVTPRLSLIPRINVGITGYNLKREQVIAGTATSTSTLEQYYEHNSGFSVGAEVWLAYSLSSHVSLAAVAGYNFYQSSPWRHRWFKYDQASQVFYPGVGIIYRIKKGLFPSNVGVLGGIGSKKVAARCSPF